MPIQTEMDSIKHTLAEVWRCIAAAAGAGPARTRAAEAGKFRRPSEVAHMFYLESGSWTQISEHDVVQISEALCTDI